MITDDEKFYDKVKTFFKMNWWVLWISNALIVVSVLYSNNSISKENQEIAELLKKEVNGVVFLGANGQAIFSGKETINANSNTSFKEAIQNNLLNYLIMDNSKLTKDYTLKIKSAQDIVDNYYPMKEFLNEFVSKDKNYNAIAFFETLLIGYVRSSLRDKLPEQIVVYDSTINSYSWHSETQTFDITVNAKVNAYIYNSIKNIFDKKQGTVQINAKGYFNLAENSTINPLGLKYYEMSIINVEK
ncbi:hypothetical protein [Campylobacter canadensis]|uniref:hypothetical protein n=1 Tax=Campylobacter canadensis TaxID=449520 RepID=UPI001CC9F657|nr:hypothetical protein [Campylobacter canadensis]MBZ8002372.1 hypothetical protein [Campylobacter canadensis]